ncbi:hypothetical protein WMY93_017359 [Mugilogobius chulae]|uniref:UBR-type domain-containing protein n=1 Tax=Mugilogobius chulae TaxID=88201 RepID=A0AAW0NY92_9GOBI
MAENNLNGVELETEDPGFLQEALSALAGSDLEHCSYERGYVKRQAVFACNTCTSNPDEPAGVCLACANKCHDNHDLFELYTKRNFRCDCGNGRFGEFKCQLIPSKDPENVKNQYNHNFSGRYCTCDRLYPDPNNQESGEFIQCVICEDWYHSTHLGCTVAEPEELEEMVCETCMNRAPFLWTYAAHFAIPPVVNISPGDADEQVDVEAELTESAEASQSLSETPLTNTQQAAENPSSSCKRKRERETSSGSVPDTAKTSGCRLKELEAEQRQRLRQGAVFWPSNWRLQLCTCTSCKRAYVSAQVQFLMDPSDSLEAYENKGLEEPFGKHPLLALTESLSHTQQLEVIYGYQEMTTTLETFFQECAEEGKIITAEEIRQCFEQLKERIRKRRRTDTEPQ